MQRTIREAVTYVTRALSPARDRPPCERVCHRISRRGHVVDTRPPYGGHACPIRSRCSAGV